MSQPMSQPMPEVTAEPMGEPMGVTNVNPSMRARERAPASISSSSSSSSPISQPSNVSSRRGWDGQPDFQAVASELKARGVSATLRSLLAECSLSGIVRTVEWWDGQQAGRDAPGPGALVGMIRRGGIREPASRRSSGERNRLYGEQVCRWLLENFPELERENGRLHLAAVACVFRLHQRDGKGSLTRARHGGEIRAAVRAFDDRWPVAYPKTSLEESIQPKEA